MKEDTQKWMRGEAAVKTVSKETLNHKDLVEFVSGLDVYTHTQEAYLRAYEALGIDLINRVPLANAPVPTAARTTRPHHANADYEVSPLGVFDTAARMKHPCEDEDEVFDFDMAAVPYTDLITPVPHPCDGDDIRRREVALGEIGCYYPMLYTTLFMWPVEVLGWEHFMLSAMEEPDDFFEQILQPCIAKSRAIVAEMVAASTNEVIFVHDDISDARGPVFQPDWYESYIFPHYKTILEPARQAKRKVVLVADGNLSHFLPRLVELGFDGLMFENPATPMEAIFEAFDRPEHLLIGGMDTNRLTNGSPEEVAALVRKAFALADGRPGFALSSCGGLHGGIPMANLQAYFDTRAEFGVNPADWRTCRKA